MTAAEEIKARLLGNQMRADEIKRLQERLARLIQEQESAWQRIHQLQSANSSVRPGNPLA